VKSAAHAICKVECDNRIHFHLATMASPDIRKQPLKFGFLHKGKVENAMAGSPDAVSFHTVKVCNSFSPSCLWLSMHLPETMREKHNV
jgi:hypothetical protein